MIELTYKCDVCRCVIVLPTPSGQRPAQRLKFSHSGNGDWCDIIELRPLDDKSASDSVLCGKCLNGLKKALGAA